MVTVAIDVEPTHTYKWIDAAAPTHPSLIDTRHVTDELFGFVNIPMAVWIDEEGRLVRPAEGASITPNQLRGRDIPEGLPERISKAMHEVRDMPDTGEAYRAAIVDWAHRGAASPYALSPDEVVARSQPRGVDEARAAACFALGEHLLKRSVDRLAGLDLRDVAPHGVEWQPQIVDPRTVGVGVASPEIGRAHV